MLLRLLLALVLAACVSLWNAPASATPPRESNSSESAVWDALKRGGHVVLMRHAQTVPGTGDPPNFKLNDCTTQRNLNDVGRTQSRAWGEAFTKRNIPLAGVYSSQWCRCVDTAKIAFGKLARVDTWPALNSHFDTPQTAALQAEQVRGGISVRMKSAQNIVLVTHQVNITELTGRVPAMGEAIVLRWESATKSLQYVGSIAPPTL